MIYEVNDSCSNSQLNELKEDFRSNDSIEIISKTSDNGLANESQTVLYS